MAGRFRLYLDANIHGPLADALRRRGWDLVRAVDVYPEGTDDITHFERAARDGRAMVSNDADMKEIGEQWFAEARPFPGLLWWPKQHEQRMSVGEIVEAFEEQAAAAEPFSPYPIVYVKPKR